MRQGTGDNYEEQRDTLLVTDIATKYFDKI